jgi:hypothetical protein
MGIRKKILQGLANLIVRILENEENEYIFNYYFNLGLSLDAHAISLGIYLE